MKKTTIHATIPAISFGVREFGFDGTCLARRGTGGSVGVI